MERRCMSPEIMGILVPIILGSGVITLIGLKMRYKHIEEIRLSQGEQPDVEHLTEAVDHLRAEVERLNERVEFTERLLERPKTEE
jgi:hypothetical protein